MNLIGWDIGGAHLKAAHFSGLQLLTLVQVPCPLWQGLEHLAAAFDQIEQVLGVRLTDCRHALTMTGELADRFPNRTVGVLALCAAARQRLGEATRCYSGAHGLIGVSAVDAAQALCVASANWRVAAEYAARVVGDGLWLDVGSTTSDLVAFANGRVQAAGVTDFARLASGELVYTGVVRTPLCALAQIAPVGGQQVRLMAEWFATSADVYRILGELPEAADQHPAVDNGDKTVAASVRRLGRMVGVDWGAEELAAGEILARFFRERQIQMLVEAALQRLAEVPLRSAAPVVGAGVGSWIAQSVAERLQRPYRDAGELLPVAQSTPSGHGAPDAAPAVCVALLALAEV